MQKLGVLKLAITLGENELEDLSTKQFASQKQVNLFAFELIENSPKSGILRNAEEVDEYIKAEPETW